MPVCFVVGCLCGALVLYWRKRQPRRTQRQIRRLMDQYQESRWGKWRNLSGFWLLGLTNNFAYVIMLSAAHDILSPHPADNTTSPDVFPTLTPAATNGSRPPLVPGCHPLGTGVILLADILPTLLVKLCGPFFLHLAPYSIKVATVVLLEALAFPIVARSKRLWLSLSGVVCASLGAGLGEITFLSLSSHFNHNVVSTWSSGTGMAGVGGALSYAGLTALGLSPRTALYIMLVVPAVMAASYFLLLEKPPSVEFGLQAKASAQHQTEANETDRLLPPSDDEESSSDDHEIDEAINDDPEVQGTVLTRRWTWSSLQLKEHLGYIKPLLKYMIPLALVYFAEYFINQALFELMAFAEIWLPEQQQYRWYQVTYQLGVFVSRSSGSLISINRLWLLPILQFCNVTVLLCQVFLKFVPSIWIIFALILFEGLLGGAAYVNTFSKISKEVAATRREFSMGVASVADSLGIAAAGVVAVPAHNAICRL